jgi:glutathione S-transferase
MRLYDYASSGNCYKVRLALAQLGIGYERVPVDIFAGDTLTDEFARVNPARTTPVLVQDGERPLTESNAILLHLAEGTDLLPADAGARAQAYRWLFFEQADVRPAVAGLRFMLLTGRLTPDHPGAGRRRADGDEALALLDHELSEHEFLAGSSYSVADMDISMYAYVHVAGDAGYELPAGVRDWIARVEAQPGHMNDLEPYPENSHLGNSRSIYG